MVTFNGINENPLTSTCISIAATIDKQQTKPQSLSVSRVINCTFFYNNITEMLVASNISTITTD
jgi:hypothetical protein